MRAMKMQILRRTMAVLLSLTVIMGIVPVAAMAETIDYPGDFTVTVKDSANNLIDGASVTYEIHSGSLSEGGTATTVLGIAVLPEMADFAPAISGGDMVAVDYTVTKDGYTASSSSYTVAAVNGNMDVVLSPLQNNQVTVTVNQTGTGTVQLDDQEINSRTVSKGTQVKIGVYSKDGWYISSLSIGGEKINVSDKWNYTNTIQPQADTSIDVTFTRDWNLQTYGDNSNGTILLDHAEAQDGNHTYQQGASVILTVTPDSGYMISSVIVDNVKKNTALVSSYEETLTINKDHTVNVQFVKVYTVTVSYDSSKGTVTSDSPISGGTVTALAGQKVSIQATPNANYRITQVKIDGQTVVNKTDNTYTSANPYKNPGLSADADHTVEITFALMICKVTVTTPVNGTVSINPTSVDYGGTAVVTVKPKEGYYVDTVKVDGLLVTADSEGEDGSKQLKIANITADRNITVVFSAKNSASINDFILDSDSAIRKDPANNLYVYSNVSAVHFSTPKTGIRLFDNLGKLIFSSKTVNTGVLTSTEYIRTIDLYYADTSAPYFHNINAINQNNLFKIVIDKTAPTVDFTTDSLHPDNCYSSDANIAFVASDPGDYSGLSNVDYVVTCNGVQTSAGVLYTNTAGTFDSSYSGNVSIPAATNESDTVELTIHVTDLAGNSGTNSQALRINTTPPAVGVSIDKVQHTEAANGYYNTDRTATITITDSASFFDANAASEGITVYANGVQVNTSGMLSSWVNADNIHTAKLHFSGDAHYTWSISYVNKGGMPSLPVTSTGSNPYDFTVDRTAPTGQISIEADHWNQLASSLTFGIWKNYAVTCSATGDDATSPLYAILYYTANSEGALNQATLEDLYQKNAFVSTPYIANASQIFTTYARITDYAGNTTYISSNGAVIDLTGTNIVLNPDPANGQGIHNGDVNVDIIANEQTNAVQAFSGIKSIDYQVIKDDDYSHPTQQGNLYTFGLTNPTYAQLVQTLTKTVKVNKENNSDNVKLVAIVKDNAGNVSSKEISMMINTDQPKIQLEYDNNACVSVRDGRGYFAANRTATITVTDRASAFDAAAATAGITISATDAKNQPIALVKEAMISGWTDNGNTHTATITFNTDGNYSLNMQYTNKAGNTSKPVDGGASVAPFAFTVDKGVPTGSVSVGSSVWNQLLEMLTFGIYSSTSLDVTAAAQDDISQVKIEYYKTNQPVALTHAELDSLTFQPFTSFSVGADEQFVVYLRLTDEAGNVSYVSSDGCIVDKTECQMTLLPEPPNGNNLYRSDVDVAIDVSDSEPYSGIRSVDYWVVKDNDSEHPTQQGNLFTATVAQPTQADLVGTWSGNVTVDASLNNSCNVVLFVKAVDNAGNEKTQSIDLDIDGTAPSIRITYDNNKDFGGNSYFAATRTATVVITERTHHFDAEEASQGIVITAADAFGVSVHNPYIISEWQTTENTANPDAATHTATIRFLADANYTLGITYTDAAGNANSAIDTAGSAAPFDFTVDTVKPSGSVTALSAEGRSDTWESLIHTLTYGFWSNQKISISGETYDATSPIASIQYYKDISSGTNPAATVLTEAQLTAITDWKAFSGLDILPNEQVTVYIKITDEAGNFMFISTNGLTVDDKKPLAETLAPNITVEPQQPINDIYSGNVGVSVQITDPLVNGAFSGLKEVSYKVFDKSISTTVPTQNGILYTFAKTEPVKSDLQQTWSGSIIVDSAKNNSNDIEVVIYAVDNAGNSSENSTKVKIDTTKPTIDVSYDNNRADSNTYFKENRTATIVVTERNFDADDVLLKMTNSDGAVPTLSGWTRVEGTGNLDNTKWTATVSYAADGDYTFDIAYTDLAGNICSGPSYAASTVAGSQFTVDKTLPTVSVSYDNNNVTNTSYYKAPRTATLVIVEHNFQADRIKIDLTAANDGTSITSPSVSGWSSVGDRHTATVTYSADADYSFDIGVTDKAGNLAADYAKQNFTVDTTLPKLSITGVVNSTAYNGDVIPVITYSDTNYDSNQVQITLVGANRKTVTPDGLYGDIHNGSVFTFKNFPKEKEADDIYTLTAKLTDKAGNHTEQTVVFSVNRFGSTYVLGAAIEKRQGTFAKEPEDVVVTEINPDKLSNITITLFKNDGTKTLIEGEDYQIDITGSDGTWYQYTYTIFKKNFEDDGVYRISIHSEDAAGNVAENTQDTKDKEISFGIDKTPPTITVANLADGTTYAVESLMAQLFVNDNLKLATVSVYLDGQEVKTWSGEDMEKLIENGGRIEFPIKGDSIGAHNVRIVCADAAGNESTVEIKDFFVTTNLWVRFFNNRILFFGTIGGVLLLMVLVILLIRNKKKGPKPTKLASLN